MKKFEFLSHMADIRMKVEGGTSEELFEAAVSGMGEILSPGSCANDQSEKNIIREISIAASDTTTLLIDFLSEVLTYAYEDKTVFCRIDFEKIAEAELKAKIFGKKVPEFQEDIKAVTYHEADVRKTGEGKWETTIIFDI